MDDKDKRSLLITFYAVSIIIFVVIVTRISDTINALYILFAFIAIQQIYRIPKLVEYYYDMKGSYVGAERYIPIYNETLLMNKFYSTVYIIGSLGILLSVLMIFMLPKISQDLTFDGLASVTAMTDKLIYLCLFLILITSFLRGLGYVEIIKDIYYTNAEIMGRDEAKLGIFGKLAYIVVFIPIIRLLSILYLDDLLLVIVKFIGYTEGDYDDDNDYTEY